MPARKQAPARKKYFTTAQANAALPLVRAIVQDITRLANDLHERRDRLSRLRPGKQAQIGSAHQEELQHVLEEFERDQERMGEYEQELRSLGVELKDPYTGLVDFPCRMGDRDVYLCWQLGEPEVTHWHELDAGFAGRQKLTVEAKKS
ncbi:MAG TPA: DUF2203 domain-containing protein [Gemmataceae bacterium]|nr:DUF2203 domain-containing protein [Gemmataceae bacterium]